MKRLGLALAGFWILLGVVVVVVAWNTHDTPEPVKESPGPMTCASMQKRAERCSDGVSDLAGELVAAHLERQGESTISAELKGTVVASMVYTAISEKKVATYCKRYWGSKIPAIRRAWAGLASCFKNPGCEGFIECLDGVARPLDLSDFL
jgi:hypothetical protein